MHVCRPDVGWTCAFSVVSGIYLIRSVPAGRNTFFLSLFSFSHLKLKKNRAVLHFNWKGCIFFAPLGLLVVASEQEVLSQMEGAGTPVKVWEQWWFSGFNPLAQISSSPPGVVPADFCPWLVSHVDCEGRDMVPVSVRCPDLLSPC